VTWGKGIAYPLIGDKVRLRRAQHDRFDDGIWEVYFFNSSWNPPYKLAPWPGGRIKWSYLARDNIRAYQHQLVPLNPLEQIVCAVVQDDMEETDGESAH
jgi:hypothetical protein